MSSNRCAPVVRHHLPYPSLTRPVLLLPLLALMILNTALAQYPLPEPEAVYEVMRRANDYWITNSGLGSATWDNSAYYAGNQRAFRLLSEPGYLQRAVDWADANQWKIGPEGPFHADAHCCGQTYLDLYKLDPQPIRIADIQQRMDDVVASASVDYWWWIDAFYMAAPTLARLGNLTGDTNYYHKLWLMYDDMKNRRGLHDASSGLWWRDESYIGKTTFNNTGTNKVFWSRGNGWVIAGLARVIEQMPTNAPERAEMVAMFQTMAAALRDLQPLHGADGLWRSSLHEPTDYDGTPETSGTAFFTFAMAWGIRNGLLNAADYTNTIAHAWDGLTNIALFPSGRLGYVQAIGAAPNYVNPNDTANYGVGAFLLACTEIALLNTNSPSVSAWAGPDEVIFDFGKDGHELVSLNASATEVYRGAADSYSWWTDGSPLATGITAQTSLALGTNMITLRVSHSDGLTYTGQSVKTVVSHLPPPPPKITYVDATSGISGNTTLATGETFTPTNNRSGTDGLWCLRTFGNGATLSEAGGDISGTGSAVNGDNEDAGRLATAINGLVPGGRYNVFAYFWNASGSGHDCRIRAGLSNAAGDLPLFSSATSPTAAADDFAGAPLIAEADRLLNQAALGIKIADESGTLTVFIDDDPEARADIANGWRYRSWYDGVGYAFITASYPTNLVSELDGSGKTLTLSWPVTHLGWILQSQTQSLDEGLRTNWLDVADSATTNWLLIPVGDTNPAVFFRLRHPWPFL